MVNSSRKVPRGARPARRRQLSGQVVEGYLRGTTFVPFDGGAYAWAGAAVVDTTISCTMESSSGGGGSYDGGSSSSCDSGGGL